MQPVGPLPELRGLLYTFTAINDHYMSFNMSNYIPINKALHGDKAWKRFTDYNHAKGEVLVPLMVTELARAQQVLPIGFTKVSNKVLPAAVLGIAQGMSLFVAPNGQWAGGYIPAHIRSYPFRLARTEEGQQVLCFNEDSGLMGSEGTRFFDESGEPSEALTQILTFLQSIEAAREPTERVCKAIEAAGLLVPWAIQVNVDGDVKALQGLQRIDEQALLALSAEQLKALADAGALPTIYAQLMSMQNINKLQTLVQLHEQHANQQKPDVDIETVFGGQDDTLKFDF